MKTKKKKYTAQSRGGGGVRRVNLIHVTMPMGSFEVQEYSPPHCHALHLFIISNSSVRSPPHCHPPPRPHLLHLLPIFSASSPSSLPPHHLLHSSVIFSMSLWCHLRWCSLHRHHFTLLVAALNTIVIFLHVSLHQRCISLVIVRFMGHYAGIVFPHCSLLRCFVDCPLCLDHAALNVADIVG